MSSPSSRKPRISWRLLGAILFFLCGLVGFASGVIVSERPDVATAGLVAQAYYSLSLFVVGGVELGAPVSGPWPGVVLLWLAYFGSPVLAAWTLIEALLKSLSPQHFQLRKLRNHVVVIGAGDLTLSYLRVLRNHNPTVPVVVVSRALPAAPVVDELREEYDALLAVGDVTHEFFLRQLRVKRALRVVLLSDNSLRSYEAVSVLLNLVPGIGSRVVMHCANLRFMRSMQSTRVAQSCETFNSYSLAAWCTDTCCTGSRSRAARTSWCSRGSGVSGRRYWRSYSSTPRANWIRSPSSSAMPCAGCWLPRNR